MLGHKIKRVKPLDPEAAITRGADLFGEIVVYSLSASMIVFEYSRRNIESKAKAEKQAEERENDRKQIEGQLTNISENVHDLRTKVQINSDTIRQLKDQSKSWISSFSHSDKRDSNLFETSDDEQTINQVPVTGWIPSLRRIFPTWTQPRLRTEITINNELSGDDPLSSNQRTVGNH